MMRFRFLLGLVAAVAVLVPAPLGAHGAPYVDDEVTFAAPAGHTLAGTLTLPRFRGPHPAIVLISGSGPQNRDEDIGIPGYRPFRVIADHLARHGIAVLRYDDRGVGKSSGSHATATSADFAEDAEAAWRYLRGRSDIHLGRIGLLGHSEGALIAAMIAARNPHVAFVVSMAGPAVNGYDLLLVQNARVLTALGASPQDVAGGVAQARVILDLVRTQRWEVLRSTLVDVARRQLAALDRAHNYDVTVMVLPRANHLFLTATTGGPQEYATLPPVFVSGFLDTISTWILDRFGH